MLRPTGMRLEVGMARRSYRARRPGVQALGGRRSCWSPTEGRPAVPDRASRTAGGVYDPGPTYALAPAYDPAVYGPGVGGTLALASPAPPTPSVIQYPTGRWELRGDGLTIPYRWVWIPNPPTAPPSPTSPSGEP